jgi:hypothetical protein
MVVSLIVNAEPPLCVRFAGETQTTSVLSVIFISPAKVTEQNNETDVITTANKQIGKLMMHLAVFFMTCPFNQIIA